MIHSLLVWYFAILKEFGLLGVVVLMAMESSIFPVPSELVIPPAAVVYLQDVHEKDAAVILILAVVLAGTIGSYIGSALTYWVARAIGRPLIVKYGKYILIPEKKLKHAEHWVARYGAGGIFMARLLPVVRHLVSIPAGLIGMRFRTFSIMTLLGSFIWCSVLTIFGLVMRKDLQTVIRHRGDLAAPGFEQAFHNLSWATAGMVLIIGVLYYLATRGKEQTVQTSSEQTRLMS